MDFVGNLLLFLAVKNWKSVTNWPLSPWVWCTFLGHSV